MALASAQVVTLIAGIIATAQPGWDDRTDKPWPADKSALAAFSVSAEGEENSGTTVHAPAIEVHDLTVRIALRVAAASGLNSAMDSATASALTAVNASGALTAIAAAGVQVWSWQRTDRDRKSTGEADIGLVEIDYLARFAVAANAPETILGATP